MAMLSAFSQRIWDLKYRLKDPAGEAVDKTVAETWHRVAAALAAAEEPAEREGWAARFYSALEGFRFLPAGRLLAGAGAERKVTLFNCFVMGTVPDDMGGIFTHLREAALTMQQGGGIGYDFSTLRPKGAPVRGVGADASGPLSFMDVWDAMCRTIMSAGSRRGAMMATLRCDHPDIEAFIAAKQDPRRLRMFNLSVLVTDAFMQAVAEDAPWDLVFDGSLYRTVSARALWDQLMQATYDYAEPGVIFIDRINQRNNLAYCESISATNPCGEQPLPPYGACLLGSINLAALVREPFTEQAALDLEALERLVGVAVRMLDNAIDLSVFPLPEQQQEAQAKRRMGLGVTGLADALILCRSRYGSDQAVALTETWLAALRDAAYGASVALARERGAFPLFEAEPYLLSPAVQELPAEIRAGIARDGIRNALLTSIAPTGTISLFADNISSGIEPVFAYCYERTVLLPDGTRRQEEVSDHAWRLWQHHQEQQTGHKSDALPDFFVSALALRPEEHVRMQAAAQRFIDSSISKTINCPEDLSFEAFKDVYRLAYDSGCKGCTTYRPNAVTGAVLTVKPTETQGGTDPAPSQPSSQPSSQPPSPQPQAPLPSEASADAARHAGMDGDAALSEDLVEAAEAGSQTFFADPLAEAVASVMGLTAADIEGGHHTPLSRPQFLSGRTYKLKWPDSDHALYVTINDIMVDGSPRPFEVFINSKNMEHYAWTVALTRMISAVFRRGGDVSFVVEELQAVFDPRGGAWLGGRYVPSLLAAIGDIIETHLIAIGFLKGKDPGRGAKEGVAAGYPPPDGTAPLPSSGPDAGPGTSPGTSPDTGPGEAPGPRPSQCPKCGRLAMILQENCALCLECGFSRCS